MALTDTVKDAAYVTIGFSVLGLQKAQVRRQELAKQFESQLAEGRKAAATLAEQIDGYVAPVRTQVEAGLDSVESTLPAPAQDLFKQARATFHQQEQVVRARLGLTAA
jgi:hypothetical protein